MADPHRKIEHVAVFEHALGPRLSQAERLVLAWPALFGSALSDCELALGDEGALLFAIARFRPEEYGPGTAERFSFWTERLGGNELVLSDLDLLRRANFLARLEQCPHRRTAATAGVLAETFEQLLATAGVNRGGEVDRAALKLEVDLGDPRAFRWDAGAGQLFVVGDRALPVGDLVRLIVTVPGAKEPFDLGSTVSQLRRTKPHGFALALTSPPARLRELLATLELTLKQRAARSAERRAAVRFPVRIPAQVQFLPGTVSLHYHSEQALLRDYTDNLSLGGTFVLTERPAPLQAKLVVELSLPNGTVLRAPGTVVSTLPTGMGIQFTLVPEEKETLVRYIATLVAPAPLIDATVELFKVKFATPLELSAERAALLARGFFLPTDRALELQTEIQLQLDLPDGSTHVLGATVVSTASRGLGLELHGDSAALDALSEAIVRNTESPDIATSRLSVLDFIEEAPPPAPDQSAVLLGDYELFSLLGAGGMAEVFYARALAGRCAGQHVALKRLNRTMAANPEAVKLFLSEGDLLQRLEHPNIVKTHDTGKINGDHIMVMEVVDGRDLGQILRRCKQRGIFLPIDFVCFLIKSMLDGLDCAHRALGLDGAPLNLVHCDVSPSNVFISRGGEIKLGDFGLARTATPPGEPEEIIRGKPSYLSPEALEGEVSVQGDLWACNVTLYESLTLELPFTAPTHEQQADAIKARKWKTARSRRDEIPAALDELLIKGFEKKKKKRFASAAELSTALTAHFDPSVGTPLAIAAVVRGLFDARSVEAQSGIGHELID